MMYDNTDEVLQDNSTDLSSNNPFKNKELDKASLFSKEFSGKIVLKKEGEFKPKNGSYRSNYSDYKKPKKPIFILVLLVVFLISCLIVFVNRDKIFNTPKGKRTIMIYMVGSDLESKYLAGTKDINEMIDASINFDDINILIYTGGSKKWHIDDIPNDKQALFEITSSGLTKIEEFDSQNNMLDYNNLSYLLNYGYENYETEYYDLILWDHGAGPIYGYGYDEYYKIDSMTLKEIKTALDNSPFNSNNKLELFGFDACLMSSIEVANMVADYSQYMVASQEFEPGNGWDYSFLKDINRKTSSVDFGKSIIDYYYDYYESKEYVKGYSLSLLRLSKMDSVKENINKLFVDIDSDLTISFSAISRGRSVTKSFGRLSSDTYYYDLVDLNDLISRFPNKYDTDINDLKSSLSDLVIYQKTDLESTNGVSIYFPYENKKEINSNLKIYYSLNFSKEYYEFINEFSTKLTGTRISNWNLEDSKMEAYNNGLVTITLAKDVVDNYSSADYIIFEKTSDNYFIPIFNSDDVTLKGNVLSTTISNKAIVAFDNEGNKLFLTSFLSSKGKDYVKYYLAGTLSKINTKDFQFDVIPVYLEFVVDSEHPDGYVASVFPMDVNDNYTYSKVEVDIYDWDTLNLLNFKYKILDAEGNYTSNWENSGEVQGIEFDTEKDYIIKLTNLDVSKKYYCLFRVKDSQGNMYLSKIVEIKNK